MRGVTTCTGLVLGHPAQIDRLSTVANRDGSARDRSTLLMAVETRNPQVERWVTRLQRISRGLSEITRLLELAPLRRGGSPNLVLTE